MNVSMHVCTTYMGGVATLIPGAGQSALEGCLPAAMTRPMHTCNQGHRSRAQTVAALRQSMNELNTAVIGKTISSWILTSSRTVPAKRKNYRELRNIYRANLATGQDSRCPVFSAGICEYNSIITPSNAPLHGRYVCRKGKITPHYFTNTAPLFRNVMRSNGNNGSNQ